MASPLYDLELASRDWSPAPRRADPAPAQVRSQFTAPIRNPDEPQFSARVIRRRPCVECAFLGAADYLGNIRLATLSGPDKPLMCGRGDVGDL